MSMSYLVVLDNIQIRSAKIVGGHLYEEDAQQMDGLKETTQLGIVELYEEDAQQMDGLEEIIQLGWNYQKRTLNRWTD